MLKRYPWASWAIVALIGLAILAPVAYFARDTYERTADAILLR